MVRGKNRLFTDAVREIRHTFSRFLSILVLSALAVSFLVGLRAAAPDMEYTADNYYDRTSLMDGYVMSTMGLTDEDLAALAQTQGIDRVEGAWSVDATAVDSIVSVRSMPRELNLLEIKRGRLPERADECVTEELLLTTLELDVGDTIQFVLEEDQEGQLTRTSYTIVGTVNSPLYVGTDRGSSSLGGGSVDAFAYVPGENFDLEVYTTAYFTGDGLMELDSYGSQYQDRLDALVDSMDALADERAALRDEQVRGEAQQELDDARAELEEAQQELDDARAELDDARAELDEGWADYEDGVATLNQEIHDGRLELDDAQAQLQQGEADYDQGVQTYQDGLADYQDGLDRYNEGLAKYNDGVAQYESGLAQYQAGVAQYQAGAAQLDQQQAQVNEGYAQYEAALAPYVGTPYYDAMVEQLAPMKAQLDAAQAQLDQGYAQLAQSKAQLDAVGAQLTQAKAELDAAKAELDESRPQLDAAKAELDEAQAQLEQARQELDQGWADYEEGRATLEREEQRGRQELADALAQLQEGEAEYADGLAEYEESAGDAEREMADARQEIADGQAELDKLEPCRWYVLGRDTNTGIAGYSQDADRIGNLANIFPVIFFLVAALACLTTMTRMVEEQRTQIGALKALGFSRRSISWKYIGYAFSASLVGGVLGLAVGATLIPAVIANAFNIMYAIPSLEFKPQPVLSVLAVLAAVVCTTGAALWACLSTLMDTPANLMRPKAPKAGRRVFLEYIKPVWRRLSFTWKVTMRNLFRYQRRFWMTVIGIGGCTALIVTGFGLHESIFDILDKQFDEISLYDATVGLDEDLTDGQREGIEAYLDQSQDVDRYLFTSQEAVEVSTGKLAHDAYLFAVDDMEQFHTFLDLRHRTDDQPVTLDDSGVVITEKLAELLEVSRGDTIVIDGDKRVEATVSDIVENYVYHYVYLTGDLYQTLFGEAPAENVALLAYDAQVGAEGSNRTSVDLMRLDGVSSYSYIATIRDSFTDSMSAVNYAVIIIIVAAAALAFVVLYNLTNINITERVRELATLKVLGFYDRETTAYIYRENVFLTFFGIALGLVLGRFLHTWMVVTVEVDLVMFGRTAPPYAYLLAAGLTVLFSVLVNVAAHFKLKKVDMVESLKTVE